jgi:LytS/YehU family sensor histidine kinase
MNSAAATSSASFWRRLAAGLTVARIVWALGWACMLALLLRPIFDGSLWVVFGRMLFITAAVLLAYVGGEQWRSAGLPLWARQAIAVTAAASLATLAVYVYVAGGDLDKMFMPDRISGSVVVGGWSFALGIGTLLSLIAGLAALYRERVAQAKQQALQFKLERETLERQTADAKLAVLQSQVEPHFLFNTLANVQTLVENGSPRAAPVLQSLIAYLRAAMPQLQEGAPTLKREESMVCAYLELMQMRMPDRLQYSLDIDPALHALRLPPMTLLTLVENAVRHGIDPSERGGHIDVGARREAATGRIRLWVSDTGRGIDENQVPGIGLANLRERLAAVYGGDATLTLTAVQPQGVRSEIDLPP